MARCSICDHPQRHLLEAALHAGTSQRQIAAQFGVGKSTLGRHTAHLVLREEAVPAPAPPVPPWPTVAQVQARLATLETERATLLQEHAVKTAQRRHLAEDLPQLRFLERRPDVQRTEDQLRALEASLKALENQLATFDGTLAVAARALEDATTRHAAARKAHWARVRATLADPMEQWCARINGAPEESPGSPPLPPGRYLSEFNYQDLCRQLREQYPMEGEAPCTCALCLAPAPATAAGPLVWARRPFTYGGQDLLQGEVFALGGHQNDQTLIDMRFCAPVPEGAALAVHAASGRRFLEPRWLTAVAHEQKEPSDG